MKTVPWEKLRSLSCASILCNPGMPVNSERVCKDLEEEVHEAHHTMYGTETASLDWQLWAERIIHMPAALLG